MIRLAVLLLAAVVACSGPTDATKDGAAGGDIRDGDSLGDVPYLTRLPTLAAFEALAGTRDEVKYLAPLAGSEPTPPLVLPCYFQNMDLFPWHLDFLKSFPETEASTMAEYSAWVLRGQTRRWWGGSLRRWSALPHPVTRQPGLVTFQVYNEDVVGNPVPLSGILELAETLTNCAGFAADRLAFLPLGASQTQVAEFYRDVLAAKGVTVVLAEDLAAASGVDILVEGEAYGYLNVVPDGQKLHDSGPRDVVVVRSAPVDLSIVAALITADPQNEFSHVNLRLGEKRIPNASIPGIYAWPDLEAKQSLLVHLVAREGSVEIQLAAIDDAQRFWDSIRPASVSVVSDLAPVALLGYEALRFGDAPAFGAKAANLGELHSILAPQSRVEGFGIPVSHYRRFVEERGIQGAIEAMVASPDTFTDAELRRSALKSIRDKIREAPLLPEFEAALRLRLADVYGPGVGTLRVRFRSSSNSEDLTVASGAGLYASRSGCLDDDDDGDDAGPSACLGASERAEFEGRLDLCKEEQEGCPECPWLADIIAEIAEDLTEEKTVADAVRKVWASLWSDQAFQEREYWGIDHRAATMAIAVNPTFVLETRDAIAVTGLPVSDGTTLYQVLTVVAPESVAEPLDPRVVAEVLTFRRAVGDPTPRDVSVIVPCSQIAGATPLWTDDEVSTLAGLLFTAHDHFASLPWKGAAPTSFDLEIKKDAAGRIILKQARPYLLTP